MKRFKFLAFLLTVVCVVTACNSGEVDSKIDNAQGSEIVDDVEQTDNVEEKENVEEASEETTDGMPDVSTDAIAEQNEEGEYEGNQVISIEQDNKDGSYSGGIGTEIEFLESELEGCSLGSIVTSVAGNDYTIISSEEVIGEVDRNQPFSPGSYMSIGVMDEYDSYVLYWTEDRRYVARDGVSDGMLSENYRETEFTISDDAVIDFSEYMDEEGITITGKEFKEILDKMTLGDYSQYVDVNIGGYDTIVYGSFYGAGQVVNGELVSFTPMFISA